MLGGSAYYKCTKCGYLADDRELDKSIKIMKMMKQGATPEMIKGSKIIFNLLYITDANIQRF